MPSNPFRDALKEKNPFRGDTLKLSRQPGAGEVFARSAGREFANNALGLPDFALTTGMRLLSGRGLFDRKVEIPGLTPEQNARLNTVPINLPQIGNKVLPIPRAEDISAAAGAVPDVLRGKGVKESFSEALKRQAAERAGMYQAHPIASIAGGVGGDVASLLFGRMGARKIGERVFREPSGAIPRGMAPVPRLNSKAARAADELVRGAFRTKLPRGIGRIAETATESATLAGVNNKDPLEAAAYGAGAQAAGSTFLTLARHPYGLTSAVLLGTIGIQMLKEVTPGGKDYIIPSSEAAVRKLMYTAALGLAAGTLGMGRVSSSTYPVLGRMVNSLATMSRGTVESFFKDIASDKSGVTQAVVEKFTKDPGYFGPGAMLRLNKAITDDNVSLSGEIEQMMGNPQFKKKVESLTSEGIGNDVPPISQGAETSGQSPNR